MTPQGLLQDYLKLEPRPPLDQWFSQKQRNHKLSPQDSGKMWEALDREVRSLLRRIILGAGAPGKQRELMKLWGPREIDQALKNNLRPEAPALPPPQDPLFVSCSGIPPWLETQWDKRVNASNWTPEEAEAFLRGLQSRPPLHIRINKNSGPVVESLASEGFNLRPVCEGGWEISGEKSLYLTESWKAGHVEIQDLASQKAGLLAKVRPGMRVWDLCAGEGGKTLLLAGELRGKGGVWGTDIYPRKVEHLKKRSRRAEVFNLRPLVWDGKEFPDTPETQGKDFDVVVVDAPCSASGTWRRDPEAALRLFIQDVPALVRIQEHLLKTAWSRLKPGGKLLYITCSWLVEENEAVFEPFVKEKSAQVETQGILGSPYDNSNTFWAGVAIKQKGPSK